MPESQNALAAARRIEEAESILKAIGVPKEQQNERSALVLLALAGIKPSTPWASATTPMLGITEMMEFFREAYGKNYAPNTRETVRRFTVHQFVQVGLLIPNPDKPTRPINSPHNVYQVDSTALALLKLFGSKAWDAAVSDYKVAAKKLSALREKEREMAKMPVGMPDGKVIQLSAGGQNELMKALVEEFCPRFTPGGQVLYLGDAGDKWLVQEPAAFAKLGVVVDEHGKMPDLVVYFGAKNWLVLIEAVTSHGPMNLKRKNELRELFGKSKAGLVFVTAFPTRSAMLKYLGEISWETEVWIAEAPSHMIHFNGERFLGPYES
jgi:adenine-specific DNA-methyltransferase